jgi:hypothetical protein
MGYPKGSAKRNKIDKTKNIVYNEKIEVATIL